jgi:Ca-activated chloride channel family protein
MEQAGGADQEEMEQAGGADQEEMEQAGGETEDEQQGKGGEPEEPDAGEPGKQDQTAEPGRVEMPPPEELPQPGKSTEAVEQFDQQGEALDQDALTRGGEAMPEGEGKGSDASALLMERWLEQIEGNPAFLLRNQFLLEERRMQQQQGKPLREPRPW